MPQLSLIEDLGMTRPEPEVDMEVMHHAEDLEDDSDRQTEKGIPFELLKKFMF